jgi:hypothetical protein
LEVGSGQSSFTLGSVTVLLKLRQFCLFLVDAFMAFGLARPLIGSTKPLSGQDWGNVIGYPALALFRLAFVLGVGMGNTKPKSA